jgi:hypothetical protein
MNSIFSLIIGKYTKFYKFLYNKSYIFIVLNILTIFNCEVDAIFEKDVDMANYQYSDDSSNIPSSNIKNSEISVRKISIRIRFGSNSFATANVTVTLPLPLPLQVYKI